MSVKSKLGNVMYDQVQLSDLEIEKIRQIQSELNIEFPSNDFLIIVKLMIYCSSLKPKDILDYLTVDTDIFESYGSDGFPLNSVDLVDFLFYIEDEFGIEIEPADRGNIDCLRNIVNDINKVREAKS